MIRTSRYFFLQAFELWILLCLFENSAFAGSLTIAPKSELHVAVVGEEARVFGRYEIQNRGDEDSKEVFPTLNLGGWMWSGIAQDILRSGSFVWNVDQAFQAKLLGCDPSQNCRSDGLPDRGIYPLRVVRNYQDRSGYRYSAVEVELLPVNVSPDEAAQLKRGELDSMFHLSGPGSEFEGEFEVRNTSQREIQGNFRVLVPDELSAESAVLPVQLKPGETVRLPVQIINFRAVNISDYAVFGYVEYQAGALRNTTVASGIVKVRKGAAGEKYLLAGIAVIALMAFLLYVFVITGPTRDRH